MKKRILLAEDNPPTVEVMQTELELLGYQVTVARDGVEAVERAAADSPDLIIMDILLPKIDGLKAVAQIRANPNTQNIPVLAATAKAMPGDREKCFAAGCDDYIAKPFTHIELGAKIRKLLDAKQR